MCRRFFTYIFATLFLFLIILPFTEAFEVFSLYSLMCQITDGSEYRCKREANAIWLFSMVWGLTWFIFWSGIGIFQVAKGLGAIVSLLGAILMFLVFAI